MKCGVFCGLAANVIPIWQQRLYFLAAGASGNERLTIPDRTANKMSAEISSTYILVERRLPKSIGRALVAMTTGLKPYGATPSLNTAFVVATRWSAARPSRNPPPIDDP